jgi:hypothetical protein
MKTHTTTNVEVRGLQLRHVDKWHGKYKGIQFEISRHNGGGVEEPHSCWCFYLFIHEQAVPTERVPSFFVPLTADTKHPYYDYDKSPLNRLEGWNGGITYYDIENHRGKRCVKAGCDYDHLWDRERGWQYDLNHIVFDCQQTIDSLIERCPWLMVQDGWNGKWYPREGMEPYGDGFISPEGKVEKDAYFASRKEPTNALT